MDSHETLLRAFFGAFARRDAEAMSRCYHPDVFFSDPVFPALHGEAAGDMWRMLLARAADLEVTLDDLQVDEAGGEARWTARYTFPKTGRKVVNRVRSRFAFREELILRHYDRFSLWRWSAQALGPVGRFFGWSRLLKWKVRKDAEAALVRFRERARPGDR